jgi:RNA polymerase sigma-70 factor (ECF subfamily)
MLAAFPNAQLHSVLVNGAAGVVVTLDGRPFAVMGFLVVQGRIVEINTIAEPERVNRITAGFLGDESSE